MYKSKRLCLFYKDTNLIMRASFLTSSKPIPSQQAAISKPLTTGGPQHIRASNAEWRGGAGPQFSA